MPGVFAPRAEPSRREQVQQWERSGRDPQWEPETLDDERGVPCADCGRVACPGPASRAHQTWAARQPAHRPDHERGAA